MIDGARIDQQPTDFLVPPLASVMDGLIQANIGPALNQQPYQFRVPVQSGMTEQSPTMLIAGINERRIRIKYAGNDFTLTCLRGSYQVFVRVHEAPFRSIWSQNSISAPSIIPIGEAEGDLREMVNSVEVFSETEKRRLSPGQLFRQFQESF